MGKAFEDIAAERRRQIEVEGYTPEHDDQHRTEDLGEAAHCYRSSALGTPVETKRLPLYDDAGEVVGWRDVPGNWPWEAAAWKPKTPRQDLVRAGALCLAEQEWWERDGQPQVAPGQLLDRIVAEIERLDRAAS